MNTYRRIVIAIFLLLLSFLPCLSATPGPEEDTAYVQLSLFWTTDRTKIPQYFQKVGPILGSKGLRPARFFSAINAVEGEGMDIPALVVIIVFPDKATYEAFAGDAQYHAARWDNQGEDKQLVIAGPSLGGVGENAGAQSELPVRQYFVELAWFKKAKKYEKYTAAADPVREAHGFKLERSFRPEVVEHGEIDLPGIANVVYHDTAALYEAYQADPAYAKLQKRYAKAVKRAVWMKDTPGQ